MSTRVRFAPSPTGIPHIGNTRTALYNYLFTKANKGKFILRIEDTDQKRLVPESLDKILEILNFIGVVWDEGPQVGGPHKPYIQSKRLKIYQDHATKLVKQNKAYYCFCDSDRLKQMRATQQKNKQLPRYDRNCLKLTKSQINKKLSQKTPSVIRLKVPQTGKTSFKDLIQGKIEFENKLIDDQVLLKSDGFPTYHLGVVVDDYLMKISHVLRGSEWISSTPKHILLYQAFNWPLPQFGHFSIILGQDKAKLSKRHGAKSVLDYRDLGYLPEALITFMSYLGWSHQDNSSLLDLKSLITKFSLKTVQTSNPVFDLQKLDYFNALQIRKLSNQKLIQLIKPFLTNKLPQPQLKAIIPHVKERLVKLKDINHLTEYFVKSPKIDPKAILKESKADKKATKEFMNEVIIVLTSLDHWTVESLETTLKKFQATSDFKPRPAFMTIRLAVTGRPATPPLFDVLQILGKKTVLKRLNHAQKAL